MSEVLHAANSLQNELDYRYDHSDPARALSARREQSKKDPSQSVTVTEVSGGSSAFLAWCKKHYMTIVLCTLYFGIGCAYYCPVMGWDGYEVCHRSAPFGPSCFLERRQV